MAPLVDLLGQYEMFKFKSMKETYGTKYYRNVHTKAFESFTKKHESVKQITLESDEDDQFRVSVNKPTHPNNVHIDFTSFRFPNFNEGVPDFTPKLLKHSTHQLKPNLLEGKDPTFIRNSPMFSGLKMRLSHQAIESQGKVSTRMGSKHSKHRISIE